MSTPEIRTLFDDPLRDALQNIRSAMHDLESLHRAFRNGDVEKFTYWATMQKRHLAIVHNSVTEAYAHGSQQGTTY